MPEQSALWQAWLAQQQAAKPQTLEQQAAQQQWFAQQQAVNAQTMADILRDPRQAQATPTQRRIVEGRVVERRQLTPEEAAAVQVAYLWDAE